jgi:hypothetical protein
MKSSQIIAREPPITSGKPSGRHTDTEQSKETKNLSLGALPQTSGAFIDTVLYD